MNYTNKLKEEGFASSRVTDLVIALDGLHRALSRCDLHNLRLFFSKSIMERLGEFAEHEGGLIDFRELTQDCSPAMVALRKIVAGASLSYNDSNDSYVATDLIEEAQQVIRCKPA